MQTDVIRRWLGLVRYEVLDPSPDLVADRPYGVNSLAGWVFEYPVVVALAGRALTTPQRSARLAMPEPTHPKP
jgi:hypothetical protein